MLIKGGGPKGPPPFLDRGLAMVRRWIAISLMTGCVLFTAFTLTMALSYQIHERCTDQMARDGNC
jgi:hypothetical protein